jgi:hypothetical protein
MFSNLRTAIFLVLLVACASFRPTSFTRTAVQLPRKLSDKSFALFAKKKEEEKADTSQYWQGDWVCAGKK